MRTQTANFDKIDVRGSSRYVLLKQLSRLGVKSKFCKISGEVEGARREIIFEIVRFPITSPTMQRKIS